MKSKCVAITSPAIKEKLELIKRSYLPDDELSFHGRSHPEKIWRAAEFFIARCRGENIPVDTLAVKIGTAAHDVLYHVPAKAFGYTNSEQLSAATMRRHFESLVPDSTIKIAEDAIGSTNYEIAPATTEAKILRAADLSNLQSSFQKFRANTERFYDESKSLKKFRGDLRLFFIQSAVILREYLWPMLAVTSQAYDAAGNSRFHLRAITNFHKMYRSLVNPEASASTVAFNVTTLSQVSPWLRKRGFLVICNENEEVRQKLVQELRARENSKSSQTKPRAMTFVIPAGLSSQEYFVRIGISSRLYFGDTASTPYV